MEMIWGAIPGVLASATPHCSSFPAENTGLVDQRNSVHGVFQERRGEKIARRSEGLGIPVPRGAVYKPCVLRDGRETELWVSGVTGIANGKGTAGGHKLRRHSSEGRNRWASDQISVCM